MKYWLILFLLFTWNVQAEPPSFVYDKPNLPIDKILSAQEQEQVKAALHRDRNLIFKELIPAKNDYIDDYDRGTVHFNPSKGINMFGREVFKASNYSFHKVIIPDGTIIEGVNFSQRNPHTQAIKGKDLHFISCNLNNIELDVSWILEDCLTIHSRRSEIEENGEMFDIYEVEIEGIFKELDREKITTDTAN